MEIEDKEYWNELSRIEYKIKYNGEVSSKSVCDFAHDLSNKYHIPYGECHKQCITYCKEKGIKVKPGIRDIIVSIPGLLFAAIILIVLVYPDFLMWMLSIEFIMDHIGIKYGNWNHLIPFSIMMQGENMAIPFIITVVIAILITILCIKYPDQFIVPFVMFEILAPGVVIYLILWMGVVCWALVHFGITFKGWGLLALLVPFAIIVIIHLLLCGVLVLKNKIKTRSCI